MDVRECMVVDLDKRGSKDMFVTAKVEAIKENRNGLWSVKFTSSQKWFNYNPSRLLYLQKPILVNLEDKGLYINNKRIDNVSEAFCYTDGSHIFYHIVYSNGYYEDLEGESVYVTRTPINKNGGSLWEYLNKLADETGLLTEDEDNILSKQYAKVDLKRDNVPLAQYLGDKTKLSVHRKPSHIYYPFGCNASQKLAVECALTHQVSIIQGPPGTGKTQTILNIIANLLMKGKSVLVVSNNNSAVENVAEKLTKEGLGFIVAKLGSSKNKEEFISNQSGYSIMPDWELSDKGAVKGLASDSLKTVTKGFDGQLRKAQLKAERSALLLEMQHNAKFFGNSISKEWLNSVSSAKLMKLLNDCQTIAETNGSFNFWYRIAWLFKAGTNMFSLLGNNPKQIISQLESAYYYSRLHEIDAEIQSIDELLGSIDLEKSVSDLRESSLQMLKHKIYKKYSKKPRNIYRKRDIVFRSEDFISDYPVVLSTTYSAKSCIDPKMVFDYVIMDEASQVDIKTGALALSCALNAVIVGDDKQLPNVIGREEANALQIIQNAYSVDDKYNAEKLSFLESCLAVFKEAPVTLLREHYRCHPKIIEFCNRKFYNDELVAMTTDKGEEKVLELVYTGKGNFARGHFNQREIDVIKQEIMPSFSEKDSVGIITPYRQQAEEINKSLGKDIASTVHKFQGRECDAIILSMVDNEPTEFSDDANLLNVAISRAKTKLCVVTNETEKPQDSILGQLISYMKYNNCDETHSKLHSVFDLLYKSYTAERLAFEASHTAVSEHLSENLVYEVLTKAIAELNLKNLEVICHYPLSRLIADFTCLDDRERGFVESAYSHVDFLIYNSLTKQAVQVVEVDGWKYHKESDAQSSRDKLKDAILSKFGLCLLRISTTETFNVEVMKKRLESIN